MTKEIVLSDAFWGLDPFLRRLAGTMDEPFRSVAVPSTDIWTEGSQVVVQVHLQGFAPEDVSVSMEKGDLVVQAHHQESEKDKKKKYVVRETTDSFYRRIRLPDYAETDKVTAGFDDGVLTITVPTGALPESTSIPITTGKK
jgi:HSP20 family protein